MPTPPSPPARLLAWLLTTAWVLVALAVALYGAWVATSLAVYHDGPVWLAIVGAVTCFFFVPLGWELLADRHQRGGRIRDAILRSGFLSAAFLVVLLVTHPATAFKALATRGDWFLGGSTAPSAQSVRGVLHTLGDGLEVVYDLARTQVFDRDPETESIAPAPQAPVVSTPGLARTRPDGAPPPKPRGLPIPGSALTWPLERTVHPAVAAMPAEALRSIDAAGKHLGRIADPLERAKAVHDFVATRVRYDVPLLRRMNAGERIGPITARQVFADGRSVCEGYSRLLIALGKAAGLRVVRISGNTRGVADYQGLPSVDQEPVLTGIGHTWNAVEIAGRWLLIDATWDAGWVGGDDFHPEYSTAYLFAPAEVMTLTHFPEARKWQLRETPISRSDWLRQPLVRPDFLAWGLALREPTAPAINADATLRVVIDNPLGVDLGLYLTLPDGTQGPLCAKSSAARAELSCDLTTTGRYTAHLGARLEAGSRMYRSLGAVIVDGGP